MDLFALESELVSRLPFNLGRISNVVPVVVGISGGRPYGEGHTGQLPYSTVRSGQEPASVEA